jgi:hypothetical protein
MFLNQADGFDTVLALRDHVNVANALEQKREFIAGKLLVVHDYRRKRHSIS